MSAELLAQGSPRAVGSLWFHARAATSQLEPRVKIGRNRRFGPLSSRNSNSGIEPSRALIGLCRSPPRHTIAPTSSPEGAMGVGSARFDFFAPALRCFLAAPPARRTWRQGWDCTLKDAFNAHAARAALREESKPVHKPIKETTHTTRVTLHTT